jgi:hypothetical protein
VLNRQCKGIHDSGSEGAGEGCGKNQGKRNGGKGCEVGLRRR